MPLRRLLRNIRKRCPGRLPLQSPFLLPIVIPLPSLRLPGNSFKPISHIINATFRRAGLTFGINDDSISLRAIPESLELIVRNHTIKCERKRAVGVSREQSPIGRNPLRRQRAPVYFNRHIAERLEPVENFLDGHSLVPGVRNRPLQVFRRKLRRPTLPAPEYAEPNNRAEKHHAEQRHASD